METKQNTTALIFIIFIIIIFAVTAFILLTQSAGNTAEKEISTNVVTIENDKQNIDIGVSINGYDPKYIYAKGNLETNLHFKSYDAIGCEQSLTIPKLGITKILPANGETDIKIAAQQTGTKLVGSCSMGMYTFTIEFI